MVTGKPILVGGSAGRREATGRGIVYVLYQALHSLGEELKGKPVCAVESAYYNYEAAVNVGFHITTFAGPGEALTAMKQGRCVGVLYDDTAIEGDLLDPQWSDYEMPLESQEVQPWGLVVRKNQPEWVAYLSTMVSKWAKDGTILDLETKYHIRHSPFAEDAHQKAAKP